ncbi:MAG: SH3 domain-containing protein [Leptospiraceae bacterium]|nr:SH3 domain-containing protein [Leptospiraceae bacterium]
MIIKNLFLLFLLFSNLLLSEEAKKEKPAETNAGLGKQYITAKQGLNIRSEPNKAGVVIVKMPFNAEVNVLAYSENEDEIEGIKSKWVKLKYKKYTGWAFGGFVSKTPKK